MHVQYESARTAPPRLRVTTAAGAPARPFAPRRAVKWFGLTLIPYAGEMQGALSALCQPYFPVGKGTRVESLALRFRKGVFAIARAAPDGSSDLIGFTAFLPLSSYGVRLIEFGLFDGADPEDAALASGFRAAAALYWWATVAEGPAFRALPLVEFALSAPPFSGKDIFAAAGTARGLSAMIRLGFAPIEAGETLAPGAMLARRFGARGEGPHAR